MPRLMRVRPARAGIHLLSALLAFGLAYLAADRARYLSANEVWGRESLAAIEAQRGDVESTLASVRRLLAEHEVGETAVALDAEDLIEARRAEVGLDDRHPPAAPAHQRGREQRRRRRGTLAVP